MIGITYSPSPKSIHFYTPKISLDSQSVVPGPEASLSPRGWLEMQCQGSSQIVYPNQISRWPECTQKPCPQAHTEWQFFLALWWCMPGDFLALTSQEKGRTCIHGMSACWASICLSCSPLMSSEHPSSDNLPRESHSSRLNSGIMETLPTCPPPIPRENSPLPPLFPH